ncbi:MAG: leucine-rich repeat domain-containing protein [Promethearchaeota archaeon]
MIIPKKIFLEFQEKKISKKLAINQLVSLIEYSNNISFRLESLKFLFLIALKEDFFYSFLEQLAISDNDVKIRRACYFIIKTWFFEKALDLIRWALKTEKDYECLLNVIEMLKTIKNPISEEILTQEFEKIKAKKGDLTNNDYPKNKFRESLRKLSKKRDLNTLTKEEKAEILINYLIILYLFQKYYTIYFELEDGLVTHLDFSDVGWSANLLKLKYTAWISDISEIKRLKNLKRLKYLDLSYNRITSIKDLISLKSLETLILCNNKLEDRMNINYLKQMPNLKLVDLSGNKLVKEINIGDLSEIRIIRFKRLSIY